MRYDATRAPRSSTTAELCTRPPSPVSASPATTTQPCSAESSARRPTVGTVERLGRRPASSAVVCTPPQAPAREARPDVRPRRKRPRRPLRGGSDPTAPPPRRPGRPRRRRGRAQSSLGGGHQDRCRGTVAVRVDDDPGVASVRDDLRRPLDPRARSVPVTTIISPVPASTADRPRRRAGSASARRRVARRRRPAGRARRSGRPRRHRHGRPIGPP